MQRSYCYILLLLLTVLMTSCYKSKLSVKSFYPTSNATELNGRYVDKEERFTQVFHTYPDKPYYFDLDFNKSEQMKLSYQTDSGLVEKYYKGKFKENYFEIASRWILPLPLYGGYKISRMRIGKNADSDLLVHDYRDNAGWLLFFVGGGASENEFLFEKMDNIKGLKPYYYNGQWGYTDSLQQVVIEPHYDCVEFFKDHISRVRKDNKWGLINDNGDELTSIKYDTIYPFTPYDLALVLLDEKKGYIDYSGKEIIPPIYSEAIINTNSRLIKVKINGKEGYLDMQGNEKVPVIYDTIGNAEGYKSAMLYSRNGKYGYRTIDRILFPPIFDKASHFSSDLSDICNYSRDNLIPYGKVIYNGESYLVDGQGYIYKYKCDNVRKELSLIMTEAIQPDSP